MYRKMRLWHAIAFLVHVLNFCLLFTQTSPPLDVYTPNFNNTCSATPCAVSSNNLFEMSALNVLKANEALTFISHGIGFLQWQCWGGG